MNTLLKIYEEAAKRYKDLAEKEYNKNLKSYYEGKADAFADVFVTIVLLEGAAKND